MGQSEKPTAKSRAKAQTGTTKKKAAATPVLRGNAADWLELIPLITEKSVNRSGAHNTVAFRVALSASKGRIARAVAARYGVKPTKIRTLTAMPKTRRRGVTQGSTVAWKKAYVSLPEGSSIDLTV